METLKSIDHALGRALRWFCVVDVAVLSLVLAGVVFIRFVDVQVYISNQAAIDWFKLSWSDEVTEWLMTALIFIAAAELWRTRQHFVVEVISKDWLKSPGGRVFALALELLTAAFILLFFWYSLDLTMSVRRASPILAMSMAYWYAPMPIAGAIMSAYSIRNILVHLDGLFGMSWFAKEASPQ